MTPFPSPRLLADIGGTYARFTLETAPGRFEHAAVLRCADHADFHAAVSAYLGSLEPGQAATIEHAAIAIANPVEGDAVRMTNYHWRFSIEQMRQRLALETLVVVNDFTALAMALPRLAPGQRRQVGGGEGRERSVIGVLGAGSGLGVSGLIPAGEGWVALGTEGGHTSFSPRDEREIAILRHGMQRVPHLSHERLLSGPGIALIHEALRAHAGLPPEPLAAPEITRRALDGSDPLCVATLESFIIVVRPGKDSSVRRFARPVWTSSLVVPPTSGENTSLLSPKTPWQEAHLASQTSMPFSTEPLPAGSPLKSARTSMSQAVTSLAVAARPMPGKDVLTAWADTAPATAASARVTRT
jgi:glucokinase